MSASQSPKSPARRIKPNKPSKWTKPSNPVQPAKSHRRMGLPAALRPKYLELGLVPWAEQRTVPCESEIGLGPQHWDRMVSRSLCPLFVPFNSAAEQSSISSLFLTLTQDYPFSRSLRGSTRPTSQPARLKTFCADPEKKSHLRHHISVHPCLLSGIITPDAISP